MAKNFVEAIKEMRAKMAAGAGGAPALAGIDSRIHSANEALLESLRTNPNLLKKMTGIGKPTK